MARSLKTAGGRPRAWIGAAIGLGTQIIGGLINKNAQEEQAWAAKKEQDYQNAIEFARNMNQQMKLTQNAQKAYEEQFRVPYKRGGRARLRSAVAIKEGGVAIPEGDNTFLLRGRKETPNNGIILDTNGGEAIVGDGERVQRKPTELRVFSDTLKVPTGPYAGMTFSKAIGAGANKDYLFAIQQRINGNNQGNKGKGGLVIPDWIRLQMQEQAIRNATEEKDIIPGVGSKWSDVVSAYNRIYGTVPALDNKTNSTLKVNNKMGANWGTADYIGLGANILGSILSQTINRRGLASLRQYAPSRPLPYQAGKLITNFNINPQLSNLERQRLQGFRSIDRDTASSIAALSRRNDLNLTTTLAQNELYNKKYQTEAEMLNRDTLNQQEVANKNIAAYNDWRDRYNTYMGTIAGGRSESNVAMIQGIGSSIGNFLQQGIDRYQMGLNRGAYLATADKGNPEILNSYGLLSSREQRMQLKNAIMKGDTQGIQYWSGYVSPAWRRKLGLTS